jgi:tetratricopeptide (TPR) repeat protein
VQGELHPDVAECLFNIGNAEVASRRYAEGVARYDEALSVLERVDALQTASAANVRNSLAVAYLATGKTDDARAQAERALAIYDAVLAPGHPDRVAPTLVLAQLDAEQGRALEAEADLRELLGSLTGSLGADHPHLTFVLVQIGRLEVLRGDAEAGRASLNRALAVGDKLGADHPAIAPVLTSLAELDAISDPARARERLDRAVQLLENSGEDPWEAALAMTRLAQHIAEDEPASALRLAVRAREQIAISGDRRALGQAEVDALIERLSAHMGSRPDRP